MTKLDAGLITALPASDSGSTAAWGSKRINPRPQSCLCLTWSGYPLNDDDDERRSPRLLTTTCHVGRFPEIDRVEHSAEPYCQNVYDGNIVLPFKASESNSDFGCFKAPFIANSGNVRSLDLVNHNMPAF